MESNVFGALVRENFNFLIAEYGFSLIKESDCQVRFESDHVFVIVHYDAERSYELDVEIGQLKALFNNEERPFNLGEVLRTERVFEGNKYRSFQACSSDILEKGVSKLALLLSLNAKDYLLNNKFSFKRLSDLRKSESDQYELEAKLANIRREAKLAWQKKDYYKVVSLYGAVESMLSSAEKKMLHIAKKNIE